jgi:hypothetical protein
MTMLIAAARLRSSNEDTSTRLAALLDVIAAIVGCTAARALMSMLNRVSGNPSRASAREQKAWP